MYNNPACVTALYANVPWQTHSIEQEKCVWYYLMIIQNETYLQRYCRKLYICDCENDGSAHFYCSSYCTFFFLFSPVYIQSIVHNLNACICLPVYLNHRQCIQQPYVNIILGITSTDWLQTIVFWAETTRQCIKWFLYTKATNNAANGCRCSSCGANETGSVDYAVM